MSGLQVLRDVLSVRQETWWRSLQVESGASNAGECQAASLLRLTGTPKSNPELDIGLPSTWGSALHQFIEQELPKHPGTLGEQRLIYRGVPVTVDLLLPAEKKAVDWKGIEAGALVPLRKQNRPKSAGHRFQAHLSAAAAVEAGHDITDVSVVYIPRDGRTLDDCWEWSEPFDRAVADEAVDWLDEQDTRAADLLSGFDAASPPTVEDVVPWLDGLRDEPPGFCFAYCPWVAACRGMLTADTPDDEATRRAWEDFDAAKTAADEAKDRLAYTKSLLPVGGRPVAVGGWRYAWTRDTSRVEEEPDWSAADVAGYEFVFGPLPRKPVSRGKSSELRRTKAAS